MTHQAQEVKPGAARQAVTDRPVVPTVVWPSGPTPDSRNQPILLAPRTDVCSGSAVRVELELGEGHNEWALDLSTADLWVRGLPTPPATPDAEFQRAERSSWKATWQDGARGLNWSASLLCAPEGHLLLREVPVGTGEVTLEP